MRLILVSFCLLVLTYAVNLYHLSVLAPLPSASLGLSKPADPSVWIPKEEMGVNQLIVSGSHYLRGLAAGRLSQDLIFAEEKALLNEYMYFFSNPIYRNAFQFSAMRWFWGAEAYIEPWVKEEAYGVSKSSSPELDYLLDPLTRNIVYHGIHEVGQLFVDVERDDFGCSLFALKKQSNWVIGRNFDFEIGRIFDEEKVMKWSFPQKGNAYLSVAWAGMIGTLTGVNEKMIYISINAAGTKDFRRYGNPSSLVVSKALMEAASAEQAVKIIEDATVFISDIYIVADANSGALYHIEKTPKRFFTRKVRNDFVVTNHFSGKMFKDDPINHFRKIQLTSNFRLNRGEMLLETVTDTDRESSQTLEEKVLSFLRDKSDLDSAPLHLGNRKAIDALIASHSIVFNTETKDFFVSRGPALAGVYVGFNLAESFRLKTPVRSRELPADPSVTNEQFYALKASLKLITKADGLITKGKCAEGGKELGRAKKFFFDHANYYTALGKYYECSGDKTKAKENFQIALDKNPAYIRQLEFLKDKVM